MPYCPTCAVEIEKRHQRCPLCGAEVADQCPSVIGTYPQAQHLPPALPFYWPVFRRRFYTVVTVLLAVPLLIVFFIDLSDSRLTWSLYVMASLAAAWALIGSWLYQAQRLGLLLTTQGAITLTLLLALDLSDRSLGWSLSLGLPLLAATIITIGPVLILWQARRLHLFHGMAWLLWSLGVLCVATEMIIERHLGHLPLPNWSLIPLAVLILTGIFFLYLHVRVAKHVDLDKWFHL